MIFSLNFSKNRMIFFIVNQIRSFINFICLQSLFFLLFDIFNVIWQTWYNFMKIASNTPIFTIKDITVQISSIIQVNNFSKLCKTCYLWLAKRILFIKINLKHEMAIKFCYVINWCHSYLFILLWWNVSWLFLFFKSFFINIRLDWVVFFVKAIKRDQPWWDGMQGHLYL